MRIQEHYVGRRAMEIKTQGREGREEDLREDGWTR